ncbi:MAG: VanZ family protein [Myxococcota bacterium]|nr:VanZ family protein [Myxococcota bacterium]
MTRQAWIRFACAAYLAAIVAIVVIAGLGGTHEMFGLVTRLPLGDKIGHFVLIGGLALAADLGFGFRSWRRVPVGPALVVVLALGEEVSQLFLATRSFDLGDLAADALGVATFTWLGRRARGG